MLSAGGPVPRRLEDRERGEEPARGDGGLDRGEQDWAGVAQPAQRAGRTERARVRDRAPASRARL